MRKVLLIPDDYAMAENTDLDKYYGVIIAGDRCPIMASYYTTERTAGCRFRAVSPHGFTGGNGFGESDSLPGVIERYIVAGFLVFEFDTPKQLFSWLAE
jgi:hypothetical protein